MIPLGLRLVITGGREAITRLIILAVAVGLGVGLLLTAGAREHGITVILVTHDARVAAYADREVVVRDGKVGTLTGAQP